MTETNHSAKKFKCDQCGIETNQAGMTIDLNHLEEKDLIEKDFGKLEFVNCWSCFLTAQGFKPIN